jgi:hypothetical protein
MGGTQAYIASAPKKVWGAVGPEGKGPGMGMSRDFPTAKEVADGE